MSKIVVVVCSHKIFSSMEDSSDLIAAQLVVWTDTPPIPKGTQPLANQVAGHVFGRQNGHRKNQLGKCSSCSILSIK